MLDTNHIRVFNDIHILEKKVLLVLVNILLLIYLFETYMRLLRIYIYYIVLMMKLDEDVDFKQELNATYVCSCFKLH